jgi:MFS family permease
MMSEVESHEGSAAEAGARTAVVRLASAFRGAAEAARSRRGLVTLALMLAMAVAALEQTVVSTAMPSIIASLRGLDIYPWVFSAYLLAATVSTPLYGKIADIFGRKRVLLFGLGLFGLGSALSGMAQSMPQLIAMRVVQGLGAGALGPIVLTMIGDMFTLEERGRVQGLFSGVWGVSSLAGPALGGVLTDQLSWRWVFFVTVPFAAVSAWILVTQVRETVKDREPVPIDWAGAGLLSAGTIVLLLAVLHGGHQSLALTVGLLVVATVLLALFAWCESRAADPVLPLDLLRTPHIAAAIAGSFLIGVILFGIDTYIPLFVQGVKGGSATVAGRTITPLFLTWSISVAVAARVVVGLGFRTTAVAGSVLITSGSLALAVGTALPAWSSALFLVGMVLIGLGMGPMSLCCIVGVQNAVPWGRRGVATGAVIFFRTMGGALGVGALGASLGWELSRRLAGTKGVDVAAALRPETHGRLTPEQLLIVQEALGRSLRNVFLQIAVLAALAIVASLGLSGGRAISHDDAGTDLDAEGEDLTLAVGAEY